MHITLNSIASGSIESDITNSAKAIKISASAPDPPTAVAVAGVVGMNKIRTDEKAYIDSSTEIEAKNGDVVVHVTAITTIDSEIVASSLAIGAGVSKSTAISVGLSTSRNEIHSDVLASIANSGSTATPVKAVSGRVIVGATKDAKIDATVKATAIAVAVGFSGSPAVSGGGALAFNTILGRDNAFIADSTVAARGDVTLKSDSSSKINADVLAAAAAGRGARPRFV